MQSADARESIGQRFPEKALQHLMCDPCREGSRCFSLFKIMIEGGRRKREREEKKGGGSRRRAYKRGAMEERTSQRTPPGAQRFFLGLALFSVDPAPGGSHFLCCTPTFICLFLSRSQLTFPPPRPPRPPRFPCQCYSPPSPAPKE